MRRFTALLTACNCRDYRHAIKWWRSAPARLHSYVMNRLLAFLPEDRPTPAEVVCEFDVLLECLKGYVDSNGYLKSQYTLEELTTTFPPAPQEAQGDAEMAVAQLEA